MGLQILRVVSYNVNAVARVVGERDRASTAVPWCWSHVRSRYRTPGPWQERGHWNLYHASLYGLGCNQGATTWRSGICEYAMEILIAVFQIVRISLVTIHSLYLSTQSLNPFTDHTLLSNRLLLFILEFPYH